MAGTVIDNWGRPTAIVVAAVAVAAASFGAIAIQHRTTVRRAEERLLRAHARALDRGHLRRVGARTGAARPTVDADLAAALGQRWFVVASGDHSYQAVLEATGSVWPHRRLLVPADGQSLAILLAELDLADTVVWLGDVDDFLGGDGATPALFDRLATVPDLTVVAFRPSARLGSAAPAPHTTDVLRRATQVTVADRPLPTGGPIRLAATDEPAGRPASTTWMRGAVTLLVAAATGLIINSEPSGMPVPCREFPAELRVRTAPELVSVLRELAARFRRASADGGCQRVNVQVQSTVSAGSTIEALSRAWSPDDHRALGTVPDILITGSSLDVARIRQELERTDNIDVRLDSKGSIAKAPIVLAVPRSALGHLAAAGILTSSDGTDRKFRWSDLVAASGGAGIGRASPRSSSAGLAATFALYRSALGLAAGEPLDKARLTAPGAARRLRDVELRIASHHEETGDLLCSMRTARAGGGAAGPPWMVALLPEQSIVDFREGRPLGGQCASATDRATDPLVSLTAVDGTPFLDYPFIHVRWRNPPPSQKRTAMVDAFHRFLGEELAQATLQRRGFRNQHGATGDVEGLSPRRLEQMAPPDGQQIIDLIAAWEEARKPARMLLAVDTSQEMDRTSRGLEGNHLRAATDAIIGSLRLIGERDQIGLWETAAGAGPRGHRELVPLGPPQTLVGGQQRVELLRRWLGELRTRQAAPAVSQTILDATDRLRQPDGADRDTVAPSNALIVLTAAGNAAVGADAKAILTDERSGRRVPIFLIVFGVESCEIAITPTLRETIQDTRGACFPVTGASDVRRAMDGLAAALWSGKSGNP